MSSGAVDASKFSAFLKSLSNDEIRLISSVFSNVDEKDYFGNDFYVICMMKICIDSEKSDRDASFLEE